MQERRIEPVHTRIAGIEAGVVVNVDRRKRPPRGDLRDHRVRHGVLRKAVGLGPRPDTVEVGLAVAVTEPLARSGDVTEQDRERARQSTARVTAQHGLDRAEPGVFVAVEQHRYEQRRRAPSRETEERRTVEHAI